MCESPIVYDRLSSYCIHSKVLASTTASSPNPFVGIEGADPKLVFVCIKNGLNYCNADNSTFHPNMLL